MGTDQFKELKRLQTENERLRRAVSDLTLDKLILGEAAKETSKPRAATQLYRPGAASGVPERRAYRVLKRHRSTHR